MFRFEVHLSNDVIGMPTLTFGHSYLTKFMTHIDNFSKVDAQECTSHLINMHSLFYHH